MTQDNLKLIKYQIKNNEKLEKHIINLLKNTEYKNKSVDMLNSKALDTAYKFAKTNLQMMQEVGITMSPMFKSTIIKRNLDLDFVTIYDKAII